MLALLAPQAALAQQTGTIDGVVRQGTPGGGTVSELPVLLLTFRAQEKIDEQQGMTDASGRFHFEGLDPDVERIYFPVVDFGRVKYYTNPITFKDASTQTAELTVYEPTESDDQILVPRANLIVTGADPDRVYVMEMGVVENRGDRSYVAAETLRFPLPAGAEVLSPQFGIATRTVSERPGGFSLTGPVLPGPHELAYSYELPSPNGSVDLSRRLEYPVESFSIFVPQGELAVSSPQLADAGTRDMGGQPYRVFSASGLQRGAELNIRVSGLPESPGAVGQRLGSALLVGGATVVVASLAIAWRRQPRPALYSAVAADAPDARRERLLATIADLDDRYEIGALSDADYHRARELAKRRLVAMLRDQERGAAAESRPATAEDASAPVAGRPG